MFRRLCDRLACRCPGGVCQVSGGGGEIVPRQNLYAKTPAFHPGRNTIIEIINRCMIQVVPKAGSALVGIRIEASESYTRRDSLPFLSLG